MSSNSGRRQSHSVAMLPTSGGTPQRGGGERRRQSVAVPSAHQHQNSQQLQQQQQHRQRSGSNSSEHRGEGSQQQRPPGSKIRLRIAGLGHHFELDASPGATLAELKEEVERRIDLPAPYQRLVAKRKKLDDDTMVLGSTVMDGNAIASMGIGLEDGTKILLLHSPLYERDREGIGKLTELMREIHKIDMGRRSREMENKLVQELVIQICCKVDGIETNGSEPLRKMRKLTIKRAEEVARKSEDDVRGVDP